MDMHSQNTSVALTDTSLSTHRLPSKRLALSWGCVLVMALAFGHGMATADSFQYATPDTHAGARSYIEAPTILLPSDHSALPTSTDSTFTRLGMALSQRGFDALEANSDTSAETGSLETAPRLPDRRLVFDGYTVSLADSNALHIGMADQFADIGEVHVTGPIYNGNFDRPVEGGNLFIRAEIDWQDIL